MAPYNEDGPASRSDRMEEKLRTDERRTGTGGLSDVAVVASIASVGLALFYYFVRGDHDRGLFVGLWAPTILGFANYFESSRARELLEETLGGESLAETVKRVVQGDT
jgi:hypothetical protein